MGQLQPDQQILKYLLYQEIMEHGLKAPIKKTASGGYIVPLNGRIININLNNKRSGMHIKIGKNTLSIDSGLDQSDGTFRQTIAHPSGGPNSPIMLESLPDFQFGTTLSPEEEEKINNFLEQYGIDSEEDLQEENNLEVDPLPRDSIITFNTSY